MGNNLKQLRNARGWTQEEAAQRVNVSRGQYIKLERGERRLTSDYIRMAANAFAVPDAAIISDVEVPVRGYLDAAAEVSFYAEPAPNVAARKAPALLLANKQIVALSIHGTALGPAFCDGILYYKDIRTAPESHMADRLCVIGVGESRVCVRLLTQEPDSGRFGLATYPDHSEDCSPISWVSPVVALLPRQD